MGHGVHIADHLIQPVKYKNRQDGAENLFLHDRIGKAHLIQNHWLYAQGLPVRLPAAHDLALIQQAQEPVKMLFIDNLSVIRVVQGLFPVLPADLFFNLLNQPVLHGAVAVNIVRRHTGLPTV